MVLLLKILNKLCKQKTVLSYVKEIEFLHKHIFSSNYKKLKDYFVNKKSISLIQRNAIFTSKYRGKYSNLYFEGRNKSGIEQILLYYSIQRHKQHRVGDALRLLCVFVVEFAAQEEDGRWNLNEREFLTCVFNFELLVWAKCAKEIKAQIISMD